MDNFCPFKVPVNGISVCQGTSCVMWEHTEPDRGTCGFKIENVSMMKIAKSLGLIAERLETLIDEVDNVRNVIVTAAGGVK